MYDQIRSAAAIASALGGGGGGAGWYRARCPVHHSKGLTLALRDTPTGLFVKCHAGCDRDDIVAELARLGLFDGRTSSSVEYKPDPAERARRIAKAREIWRQTVPADETYVKPYLWSRQCVCDDYGPNIRLHRGLYHKETGVERPAMVARVEHIDFGGVGVHATFLQLTEERYCVKAPVEPVRKSFGPIGGGSVHIDPAGETLVVGEGIETTLSVGIALDLPCWAALSATGIRALILPAGVKRVFIAADYDSNGAGQRAALQAANRFRREGRWVKVLVPPKPDTDFNDVMKGCSNAA